MYDALIKAKKTLDQADTSDELLGLREALASKAAAIASLEVTAALEAGDGAAALDWHAKAKQANPNT